MPPREPALRMPRWLDFRDTPLEQLRTMLGEDMRDIHRILADLRKFQIQTQGQLGDGGELVEWFRQHVVNNSPLLWAWNERNLLQFGDRVDTGPGTSTLELSMDSSTYERPALVIDGQVTASATPGGSQWIVNDLLLPERFQLEYRVDAEEIQNNGQWLYFGAMEAEGATEWGLQLADLVAFGNRRLVYYEGSPAATVQTDLSLGVARANAETLDTKWVYSAEEETTSPPKYSFTVRSADNASDGERSAIHDDVTLGTPDAAWAGRKLRRLVIGIRVPAGGLTTNLGLHLRDIRITRHPADMPLLSASDSGWRPRRVVPTEPTL